MWNKVKVSILVSFMICLSSILKAQGIWAPVINAAPDMNGGVMLLLTDGTVMAKTLAGGSDGYGNIWDILTPDSLGSYEHGSWTRLNPMHNTRLAFSSQVLKDGRVFVAGGEYGTGGFSAEIYDPLTHGWTMAPVEGQYIGDANSELLPDGKVLEAIVGITFYDTTLIVGTSFYDSTIVFDPVSNTWGNIRLCRGNHPESTWLKLADSSILFIDFGTRHSERYIPSLNKWVVDATVPDSIYDGYALESGPFLLLPDGRGFIIGATGHTAYYTPSGKASPGSWAAGPDVPGKYSAPDAPAAMMVNGNILCTVSPIPNPAKGIYFLAPTAYYEFNYLTNAFTHITSPTGGDTVSEPCFYTNMLDLPDGTILYSDLYSLQYYTYKPIGSALIAGKSTINSITQNGCTYIITGTLFNGISQGASFGDDWQMATNYPIIRLKSGNTVYYARTFNWNSTAVMTGNMPDTAEFTIPANVPGGVYWIFVSANGISSDSVSFVYKPCALAVQNIELSNNNISVYPNPAINNITVAFKVNIGGKYVIQLIDIYGRTVVDDAATAFAGDNTHLINLEGIAKGVYMVVFQMGNNTSKLKVMVK